MSPATTREERLATAGLVFAVVAPATYAALRLYQLWRVGHVDASLILASTHVAFVWRVAVASWFGVTCAALAAWHGVGKQGARRLALAGVASAAAVAVVVALVP